MAAKGKLLTAKNANEQGNSGTHAWFNVNIKFCKQSGIEPGWTTQKRLNVRWIRQEPFNHNKYHRYWCYQAHPKQ